MIICGKTISRTCFSALLVLGGLGGGLWHPDARAEPAPQQGACESTAEAKRIIPPPAVIRKGGDSTEHVLELGEIVVVEVPAEKYVQYFTKQPDAVAPIPVLFLNDVAIPGLKSTQGGCHQVAFTLKRTAESEEVWGRVLSRLNGKEVAVGIGTAQKGFVAEISTATLRLVEDSMLKWWYALMAGLLIAVVTLGATTGMLRDLPRKVADGPARPDDKRNRLPAKMRPYSLGRVQMAFWFVLGAGAFSYIGLVTGDWGNMPPSLLALMGISAGTTVLGAIVDAGAPAADVQEHHWFLADILTDEDGVTHTGGVSFHRVQMLVWTVLLGMIFVREVWQTLCMPDFDATLLGLMGISSGTYLGFKMPAVHSAAKQGDQDLPPGGDAPAPAQKKTAAKKTSPQEPPAGESK